MHSFIAALLTFTFLVALAMSSSPPEWTVLYHMPGKFKGRGEFLRLMLVDAGVDYVDSGEGLYGPEGCMDCFRGSAAAIDDSPANTKYPYPLFYPPAIWHQPPDGDAVLINQVGACMMYIGEQLGYAPQSPAERARANMILLNALDYISDGRSSFHPVKNSMSYKDQKEEGDRESKIFSETRMGLFLHHFNKIVQGAGSKQPVAGGENLTYADFALFHAVDATKAQFNSEFYNYAYDNAQVDALKEHYEWIKARPRLQEYFQSDKCAPFAGDSMM